MTLERIKYNLRLILFGHILNPLWHSRLRRRKRRGHVVADGVERYLEKTLGGSSAMVLSREGDMSRMRQRGAGTFVFSIWLQGEDNAPQLVKSCWKSIREHSGLQLVILDRNSLSDWITLPDYVVDKWKCGKIRDAHFTDICRLQLLWQYGGYWMDATCFMTHPFSEQIQQADVFLYMSGETIDSAYAFVQNCFIKSKAGNPMIGAWLSALLEYWHQENSTLDYLVSQMILRYVVEHDAAAKAEFDRMPKLVQDPTHTIWFGEPNGPGGSRGVPYRDLLFDEAEFQRLTAKGAFQKTTYRTYAKRKPKSGSFAKYIINYASSSSTSFQKV